MKCMLSDILIKLTLMSYDSAWEAVPVHIPTFFYDCDLISYLAC